MVGLIYSVSQRGAATREGTERWGPLALCKRRDLPNNGRLQHQIRHDAAVRGAYGRDARKPTS